MFSHKKLSAFSPLFRTVRTFSVLLLFCTLSAAVYYVSGSQWFNPYASSNAESNKPVDPVRQDPHNSTPISINTVNRQLATHVDEFLRKDVFIRRRLGVLGKLKTKLFGRGANFANANLDKEDGLFTDTIKNAKEAAVKMQNYVNNLQQWYNTVCSNHAAGCFMAETAVTVTIQTASLLYDLFGENDPLKAINGASATLMTVSEGSHFARQAKENSNFDRAQHDDSQSLLTMIELVKNGNATELWRQGEYYRVFEIYSRLLQTALSVISFVPGALPFTLSVSISLNIAKTIWIAHRNQDVLKESWSKWLAKLNLYEKIMVKMNYERKLRKLNCSTIEKYYDPMTIADAFGKQEKILAATVTYKQEKKLRASVRLEANTDSLTLIWAPWNNPTDETRITLRQDNMKWKPDGFTVVDNGVKYRFHTLNFFNQNTMLMQSYCYVQRFMHGTKDTLDPNIVKEAAEFKKRLDATQLKLVADDTEAKFVFDDTANKGFSIPGATLAAKNDDPRTKDTVDADTVNMAAEFNKRLDVTQLHSEEKSAQQKLVVDHEDTASKNNQNNRAKRANPWPTKPSQSKNAPDPAPAVSLL